MRWLSALSSAHPTPPLLPLHPRSACPCGRTFTSLSGLSSHVKSVHGGPTPGQRQGDTMLRVMMAPGGCGKPACS